MKTVIVTGASGNLGKAVVKKFLQEGYRVIGTVHRNTADDNKHQLFEKKVVDLTDDINAAQFVEAVASLYGNIDAAILTAGGFVMGNISDTKTTDINRQFKLNFETAYNIARPVFLQMKKQNAGRIFLIGSRPGLDMKSARGMLAYSLSKSLLFRLAELLNEEGREAGVVTSVVVPGTIDTPQNREAMPGADFDKWVKPAEIADVIFFHSTGEGAVLQEPILKVYGRS